MVAGYKMLSRYLSKTAVKVLYLVFFLEGIIITELDKCSSNFLVNNEWSC